MEEVVDRNPYEGVRYVPLSNRFAIYANKWPPFPDRNFIGSFETLDEAISARKVALESHTA